MRVSLVVGSKGSFHLFLNENGWILIPIVRHSHLWLLVVVLLIWVLGPKALIVLHYPVVLFHVACIFIRQIAVPCLFHLFWSLFIRLMVSKRWIFALEVVWPFKFLFIWISCCLFPFLRFQYLWSFCSVWWRIQTLTLWRKHGDLSLFPIFICFLYLTITLSGILDSPATRAITIIIVQSISLH